MTQLFEERLKIGHVNLVLVVLIFSLALGCKGKGLEPELISGEAFVDLRLQNDVSNLKSLVGTKVTIVGELHAGKATPFLLGKEYVEINIQGANQSFEASNFGAIMKVTGILREYRENTTGFAQGKQGVYQIIDQPTWQEYEQE